MYPHQDCQPGLEIGHMEQRQKLQAAIDALESQRSTLGDDVVNTALQPLKEKLEQLDAVNDHLQQRKQVTILFCDIVDSTRLVQQLDPEEARDLFDLVLTRFSEPIRKHGGHVTRYMGDAFKAVFGAHQAQENDPELAVRAGLKIVEVAEHLHVEQIMDRPIDSLQVRVGINTGVAALGGISEEDETLMGSAVNLAKRLESAAPSGGVLISHNTYRHVRGIFDVIPQEPIVAKGFDEPVPVYQVTATKRRSFWAPMRGVEGIETHMVGRDAELKYLQEAFHLLVNEAEGGIIKISGEAGVGKSRLLHEFISWIDLQPQVVWYFQGRAHQEYQHLPYALLRDLFSYRFKISDKDSQAVVQAKIVEGFTEVIGIGEFGEMQAHIIGQLLGFDFSQSGHLKISPEQLQERALRYLEIYFESLIKDSPVLICLEDLQWADDNSLDYLNRICRWSTSMPLLIVCLTRPEFFERRPHWGEGLSYHHPLSLHPLSKTESRQLVIEILQKVDPVPTVLRELIVSRAEGNPFYIEELIKMLIDQGVILTGEKRWQVIPDELIRVEVPTTLTGVLQARLERLPVEERRLLQQGAVFGKVFWDSALQHIEQETQIAKELDESIAIMEPLNMLRQKEFIFQREESSLLHTREYTFKHPLLQEVIYASIPLQTRRNYHGLAAMWLAKTTQELGRAREFAATIGDHFLCAGHQEPAIDWLLLAGQHAISQDALKEALAYFDRAIEYIPEEDAEKRWQLLLDRSEVLGILGEIEARQRDDNDLIKIATQLDDNNRLAEAYYRKGYFLSTQGQYQAELDLYPKALEHARFAGNLRIEALVLGLLAVCNTQLGNLEEALQAAEQALEIANQLDDPDTMIKTLANTGIAYQHHDIAHAVELMGNSVEMSNQQGDHNTSATTLSNLGYLYTITGHPEQGLVYLQQSQELAERLVNRRLICYNQLNLALAHLRLGGFLQAQQILEATYARVVEIEDTFAQGACHNYLGFTLEGTGDHEAALTHFFEASSQFAKIGASGYRFDALGGLARCALTRQDIAQAHDYNNELWEYLITHQGSSMEFPIYGFLTSTRVFEALGDGENMHRAVKLGCQALLESAEKMGDPAWRQDYLEKIPEHREILAYQAKLQTSEGV